MSKFGWSYPPGAANDPNAPYNQDLDDGITQLQDNILDLLEKAQIPTCINDIIMLIVTEGERQRDIIDAKAVDQFAREEHEKAEICIGCGQIRDHCECAQFDAEDK